MGPVSTKSSCTLAILIPSARIIISSGTALLTSKVVLITKEYISKLKIGFTNIRDWMNVITLPFEKTVKQSMLDKKTNDKEIQELKTIHNHYLDKKSEIMKNTEFKVEHIFGDIIGKDIIGQDQIITLKNFFGQNDVKADFSVNISLMKDRRKKYRHRSKCSSWKFKFLVTKLIQNKNKPIAWEDVIWVIHTT